ncbi:hypothetical protein F5Y00DRAFT_273563 [Daldinia vernicosa]|uniref:uncharacterized protein n=1 Tax=Daldinia vernicosa TaxID=114800 RepID=UPI0020074AC8|nr:uncharacterized protein F5Y00DRAFT_273563 [Daldinia vernicosa]KAI0844806.1 hypothetical protein F5Y00DRAFT_273563 [Daldinia vernicosa]
MAKLTDLPVELLQMIATAKARSRPILDQKDLASFSVVNWWLYRVVNCILYAYNVKHKHGTLFDYAAKHGNLDTLKVAVSFGLEAESWYAVLVEACRNRHRNIITWLMDHGIPLQKGSKKYLKKWEPSFESGYYTQDPYAWRHRITKGCPALILSIENKMEDIALLLLSHGANTSFNIGDQHKFRSILHHAASREMVKVVEYLVQTLGIPIDLKDYKGYTPLHYAMEYSPVSESTKMLKTLIKLGADINSEIGGKIPLTSALYKGRVQHANILLDSGSKIKPDHPEEEVGFPIHALMHTKLKKASFRDSMQWSILQRLFEAGADLTERYVDGFEPLEEAIIFGTPKMMTGIMALKAHMHGEESLNRNYIFDFMIKYHPCIELFGKKVEMLLKGGSRVDIPLSYGYTFLSWSFLQTHPRQTRRLTTMAIESMHDHSYLDHLLKELVTGGIHSYYLPDFATPDHLTILMDAGAKLPSAEDINLAAFSCLPHEHLVSNGWLTTILDMGFPTDRIPDLVTSALQERADSEAVEYLLDLVEPRIWQQNPQWIDEAIESGRHTVLDKLLKGIKNVDVNSVSKYGETLLLRALKGPRADYWAIMTALVLLQHGADPFLPTRHSACHGKKYTNTSQYSAFEYALHKFSFRWAAEEIWYNSAPELRPDPKVFLECVPSIGNSEEYRAEMTEWLKRLDAKDNVKSDLLKKYHDRISTYRSYDA